jgi:hypothetical protein
MAAGRPVPIVATNVVALRPDGTAAMQAEAPAPIVATVSDYDGLVDALRQRVAHLGVAMGSVEELAGVPDFYLSKIIRQKKFLGPVSFGPIIGALALKVILVEDGDQLQKIQHRLPKRGKSGPQPGAEFALPSGPARQKPDHAWRIAITGGDD